VPAPEPEPKPAENGKDVAVNDAAKEEEADNGNGTPDDEVPDMGKEPRVDDDDFDLRLHRWHDCAGSPLPLAASRSERPRERGAGGGFSVFWRCKHTA
jgi:hypothetical protein